MVIGVCIMAASALGLVHFEQFASSLLFVLGLRATLL